MKTAGDSAHAWRAAFAALHANHMQCSVTDAMYIARMLQPVLGQLSPLQALQTVSTDPAFIDEMEAHRKRTQN